MKSGKHVDSFVWVFPFHPELLKVIISQMGVLGVPGVLIWAIALYIAFRIPKPPKLA